MLRPHSLTEPTMKLEITYDINGVKYTEEEALDLFLQLEELFCPPEPQPHPVHIIPVQSSPLDPPWIVTSQIGTAATTAADPYGFHLPRN